MHGVCTRDLFVVIIWKCTTCCHLEDVLLANISICMVYHLILDIKEDIQSLKLIWISGSTILVTSFAIWKMMCHMQKNSHFDSVKCKRNIFIGFSTLSRSCFKTISEDSDLTNLYLVPRAEVKIIYKMSPSIICNQF
jgi:hypothetical protein